MSQPAPPHDVMSGAAIPLACRRELALSETHGSADFHPGRNADGDPASGQGGLDHCLGRCRPWRAGRARRGGIVVPLRHRGVFRDDRRRHLGLLLIRRKGNRDGPDDPPAGDYRCLRRKPRGRAGDHAVGDGRLAHRDRAGRDRRSVSTDRPGRPARHRAEFEGQADADLLRLYPLPGCLPDLAVRDFGSAEGDGHGRRQGERAGSYPSIPSATRPPR